MVDGLVALSRIGCQIKISVVQELPDGSASDGSFMLDEDWIGLLARLGATLDVELLSEV